MDKTEVESPVKEVTFPNGNQAKLIQVERNAEPAGVLRLLEIQNPGAVIMIAGAAGSLDQGIRSRLLQLFSRGIARAAIKRGAVIIDGGTQAGVMDLMGRGVAERSFQTPLLGVAPAGLVTYQGQPGSSAPADFAPLEPNHSHFVLVEGDAWGDETRLMYALGKALSQPDTAPPSANGAQQTMEKYPVVTILAGGNPEGIAKEEVLSAVRSGWPVTVIEGSGGLADTLAALVKDRPEEIEDPGLAEIVEDGRLSFFPMQKPVAALEQLIVRQLGQDATLQLAWQRFATYDANAGRHRKEFDRWQPSILWLGVIITAVALIQTTLKRPDVQATLLQPEVTWAGPVFGPVLAAAARWLAGLTPYLQFVVVALPILLSISLTLLHRFNAGSKWVALRGAAEEVKREIYRYRTRTAAFVRQESAPSEPKQPPPDGAGADRPTVKPEQGEQPGQPGESATPFSSVLATPEGMLAVRLEEISRQLMQSDVNLSALHQYKGPLPPQYDTAVRDDGFSLLTPDRYIELRLDDQLAFYHNRTGRLEKQLRKLNTLIYVAGGLGTLLAAFGLELWVALTTAGATAMTTYLGYQQVAETLVKYNQTATNLENIKSLWIALPPEEQADPQNVALWVNSTENAMSGELSGWVQQMSDSLAELRRKQAGEQPSGEEGAGS